MRFLVLGAAGRMGAALVDVLPQRGHSVRGLTHADLDVTDGAAVRAAVAAARADVVVNPVAYNKVDDAETDPGPAYRVNAGGAANVAAAAAAVGSRVVYVSTDYVFDGLKGGPYTEEDSPNPLGHYALSKLAGERLTQWLRPGGWMVVRTAVLFGPHRHGSPPGVDNFIEATRRWASRAGAVLRGVVDQRVSPTYTPDLAEMTARLCEAGASGVFHVAGGGDCSRLDLMCAVVAAFGLDATVTPVAQSEFGAAARRPLNSALDCRRAADLTRWSMPDWRDGLRRYVDARTDASAPAR